MAGVGSSCSTDVLLREFGRQPLFFHWVVLSARWFQHAARNVGSLSHHTLQADLALLLQRRHTIAGFVNTPCTRCWSYLFLSSMTALDLVLQSKWDITMDSSITVSQVLQLADKFAEKRVQQRLHRLLLVRWNHLHVNPADPAAPSDRYDRCTHAAWVMPVPEVVHGQLQVVKAPHLKLCAPFLLLRCLAQFRLGWHHLRIMTGRQQRPAIPRSQRLCPLCSLPGSPFQAARTGDPAVETLLHFLLQCPAYVHARHKYGDIIFGSPRNNVGMHVDECPDSRMLLGIFHNCSVLHQMRLARCLYAMIQFRKHCMDAIADGTFASVQSVDTAVARLQSMVADEDLVVQTSTQSQD